MKIPKCSICGGEFSQATTIVSEFAGKQTKRTVKCCNRCGDTQGSPEQFLAYKKRQESMLPQTKIKEPKK
jgi:hypothetical protein